MMFSSLVELHKNLISYIPQGRDVKREFDAFVDGDGFIVRHLTDHTAQLFVVFCTRGRYSFICPSEKDIRLFNDKIQLAYKRVDLYSKGAKWGE